MLTNEQKPTSAKFNDDLAKILSEDRSREAKVQDEKISELSRIMNAPVAPVKQTLTEEHKNLKVTDKTSQVIESIQNKAKPVLNKELLERIPTIKEMFADFKNVATSRSTIINEEFNKYASPDIRFNAQALREFEGVLSEGSFKYSVNTMKSLASQEDHRISEEQINITERMSANFSNLKISFMYDWTKHKVTKILDVRQYGSTEYDTIINLFTKQQILDAAFNNKELMDIIYEKMKEYRIKREVPKTTTTSDLPRVANITKSIQDTAK